MGLTSGDYEALPLGFGKLQLLMGTLLMIKFRPDCSLLLSLLSFWVSLELGKYPTSKSTFPMAYGFLDINVDIMSSSLKYETGSFYFLIPQITAAENTSDLVPENSTSRWRKNCKWHA